MFSRQKKQISAFKTAILIAFVGLQTTAIAKEGMWLPPTIKQKEADMKALGLQIPIEQIYNSNGTGLNNAVVLFGSGCTGEIISSKGLLLTNHHCGYGTVQGLSSREKDYFANGFFAQNIKEEIPCPGLSVTFIRKMENVTDLILDGVPDSMHGGKRDSLIATRIKNLEKGFQFTTKMDASIRPYFYGNQYWVLITETFNDVRLVGFPPNGIGSFGGDTDNWMWPRHTGDFSMFRVYADKNNKPAAYNKDNKPYQTKNFFTINVGGYKEGDFTMVYGFPGTTQEYISSYQLNQIYSIVDPIRIAARTQKLASWTKNMTDNRDVFLKYTSKRAGVANGWKKWQGEVRGLSINNVMELKKAKENEFQAWASSQEELTYAKDILAKIQVISLKADSALKAETYIQEALYGVELLQQSATLDKMLTLIRTIKNEEKLKDTLNKIYVSMSGFYKNYDIKTDKDAFNVLIPMYFNNAGSWISKDLLKIKKEYKGNFNLLANEIFDLSLLTNIQKLEQLVQTATTKDTMKILSDPAWRLYNTIAQYRRQVVSPAIADFNNNLSYFNRLYMKAQMVQNSDKMLYPDANLTLRLTYGQVQGMDPDGPANYSFQTNLDEAIAKNNPDVEEFKVPMKLKELHQKKDYGKWSVNGTVPIAFIASNHTSGGNSGSPVLNAKGQLIGTNFDRVWEGTMSDLYFDPNLCRNITLDVRYTLFIIEKFGNAGWLLKEMKIVK